MKIRILDEAERDMDDAAVFYSRQGKGLGAYFLDSILADIESLHLYAGIHARHFGYHRLLTKRFPFAVYYRVQDGYVYVYAVLDCRRNPSLLKRRLG